METTVRSVITDRLVRIDDSWDFHGLTGDKVSMVGLKPARKEERSQARDELKKLLEGQRVRIAEYWYVSGDVLVAVVAVEDKYVYDCLPHRRLPLIEPSRKHNPADHTPLVAVSGGLPKMWSNPLLKLPRERTPCFRDISYPTKYWEPGYDLNKKIADHLYVDVGLSTKDRQKIEGFQSAPGPAVLIVLGECGAGKTWFTLRWFVDKRPTGTDYAYIDLRGRPSGPDLAQSINRELGLYLDKNINERLDIFKACAHHFGPHAKALSKDGGANLDAFETRERLQNAYEQIAFSPAHLADYNDMRLGHYDHHGKTIYVIVDNIDTYPADEQLVVFNQVIRALHNHSGVKLVAPLRPSSKLMLERLCGGLDTIPMSLEVQSPDEATLLRRRASMSVTGVELDLREKVAGTSVTWNELLSSFVKSRGAAVIRDLSSVDGDEFRGPGRMERNRYDCRHYLRLFRRVLWSEVLGSMEHIYNEYYVIHALLLRPSEPFSVESAFLYNLFDNGDSELVGNALIRFRVLEYFHNHSDYGPIFDEYFRALGPGPREARDVADSFVNAGLLVADVVVKDGREVVTGMSVTHAGRRHLSLVTNLWYGICIKTGMLVEPEMIAKGAEARQHASKYVSNKKVLDFYARHGWVSEEELIGYLYRQEQLEDIRIGEYQSRNPNFAAQVANLLQYRRSPSEWLSHDYSHQMQLWFDKRGRW